MIPTDLPQFYNTENELPSGCSRVHAYADSLRELYFLEHPTVQKNSFDESALLHYIDTHASKSVWVFYPWRNVAVHIPDEVTYTRLRTARNRNVILDDEQRAYRNAVVGIAGLSVGSAALHTLVASGGPASIKIADFDTIEITNLNRMRASLLDVGANKTDVAARLAWEIDPYAKIEPWRDGISGESIHEFISGNPRLHVFVDEMDDIELKFATRIICRDLRIPVVMATDNGDSAILDVERFDLEPARPIFHGRVQMPEEAIQRGDRAQFVELANAIIDINYFTERQRESVQSIGKTLPGVPQLATAAAIAGAAVAYAVRMIATNGDLGSGRYVLGCDYMTPKISK